MSPNKVRSQITFLYYDDIAPADTFYREIMGFETVVDQGWAKIYPTSPTGFIGPVDGAKGMHSRTEKKGVTVSFFTDDVDGWFAHLRGDRGRRQRISQAAREKRCAGHAGRG